MTTQRERENIRAIKNYEKWIKEYEKDISNGKYADDMDKRNLERQIIMLRQEIDRLKKYIKP